MTTAGRVLRTAGSYSEFYVGFMVYDRSVAVILDVWLATGRSR